MNLKEKLYQWRDGEANRRGIELWRVLPNKSLDEIAQLEPTSLMQLARVGGIGPTKLGDYGNILISIVTGGPEGAVLPSVRKSQDQEDAEADLVRGNQLVKNQIQSKNEGVPTIKNGVSVGVFLEQVNRALRSVPGRVRGEITQFKFQGNAYFTIKDKDGDGVLDVMMWAADYRISGISLEAGMEVVVTGFSEVYKAQGRFSFKAKTLEFGGEGALKKQYEDLKKSLSSEGLFAQERKRALPEFPHRIGLITSRSGAVIEDFLNNLGRYGYVIRMIDARVEGALASASLLDAIASMKKEDIDTLVVVRGGGSIESLQAFNNEHVVRALRKFSDTKAPVVCAIGHHQDVPLAQLAADFSPSTPTASAELLNYSWRKALDEIEFHEQTFLVVFRGVLDRAGYRLEQSQDYLQRKFDNLYGLVEKSAGLLCACIPRLDFALERYHVELVRIRTLISHSLGSALSRMKDSLEQTEKTLDVHDPLRQLKLGYSVARTKGRVVRVLEDVDVGDTLEVQVSNGFISTLINTKNGN